MASDQPKERYTLGYDDDSVQSLSRRTASHDAGFLLPYLRSGMSLLDCGCGPGTITVGMAQAVDPGQVVGVDREESQVQRSRRHAAGQGADNVRFEVADAYHLQFPDNSFDAVLMHCVLDHLLAPLEALQEGLRVLKPGGLIGVRCPMGGDVYEPTEPLLIRGFELYERLREHNGSERSLGRRLRGLLVEAGFIRVEASASCDCHGSPDRVKFWGERVATTLTNPPISQQLVELGWTEPDELEQIAASWRAWSEDPGAFYAKPCGEAVGWKQ